MTKNFQRTIENFTCGHCGADVTGDGYTNHCPQCLYSAHVDNNPGDRANPCGGLMAPIALAQKGETWVVTQRCMKCGVEKPCKTRDDDIDAVIKLARTIADRATK